MAADAAVKTEKEPFVVMAKPVGSLCNLACTYCYYLEAGSRTGIAQGERMSDETLEQFIRTYIADSPGPTVSFTWHGGEPSLAGIDFYEKALRLQKKYLPKGWQCWNNLQTNGLLLDDKWCRFLGENHFDVGLSVDGAQWLHDTYRLDRGGHGTFERVAETARRLMEHGVKPDLLCTVTSDAVKDPLSVYRSLRSFGTGWMQFIPIVRRAPDGGVTPDSVTPEGYGRFLCAIFDEWITHDLGRCDVQLFAETATVLAGMPSNLCWMAPVCGRVLIVERDGSVFSCDHFVDAEHRIGDVFSSRLIDLADLPRQRAFGQSKQTALPSKCRACPWLKTCSGGCIKDRFAADENGEPGLNYLCPGLEMFFSHANRPIRMARRLIRQGMSTEAVMEKIRQYLAENGQ